MIPALLLPLLLATACEAPPPVEAEVVETVPADWSDLYVVPEHAPGLTAEEVEAEITRAFSYGLPEPLTPTDNFLALLAEGDEVCPASDSALYGPAVPLSGCWSGSGYFYAGVAAFTIDDERVTGEDGTWTGSYEIHSQSADFEIVTPSGDRLYGGGQLGYSMGRDEGGGERFSGQVTGSWQDTAAGGWLGEGISATLMVGGTLDAEGLMATIDGGLGLDGVSLYFDQLAFVYERCGEVPVDGGLRLRQDDGTWFTVRYDGSCSPCGALTWDDTTEVGEACLDFSAFPVLFDRLRSR